MAVVLLGLDLTYTSKKGLKEILDEVIRDERISENDVIEVLQSIFHPVELEFIAKGLTK